MVEEGKLYLYARKLGTASVFLSRPLSLSSNLIFPSRLSEGRPANREKLCEKLPRSKAETRSRAAPWSSWVDPVVSQAGNKGRTRRLTHALSAGACTHLHTDSRWEERECAVRRRPWSSSRW